MSFVSLRKIFFPTEAEIKIQEKMMEEIHNKCVDDRKNVKLVPYKDSLLYCREPFGSFLGDCCYCSHYDDGGSVTVGGRCTLYGVNCGWGFTCKDNDSEWSVKIKF